MNIKQKKIVGQIYHIASDKRSHILKDDCILWLEEKMRIIRKLCKTLPMEKAKTDSSGRLEKIVSIKEKDYRSGIL